MILLFINHRNTIRSFIRLLEQAKDNNFILVLFLEGILTLDSPPAHARTFGIRPASHQGGQGIRSAVVSAAGRTPLERLSTNMTMNTTNNGNIGYKGGSVKALVGRPVYGRK